MFEGIKDYYKKTVKEKEIPALAKAVDSGAITVTSNTDRLIDDDELEKGETDEK